MPTTYDNVHITSSFRFLDLQPATSSTPPRPGLFIKITRSFTAKCPRPGLGKSGSGLGFGAQLQISSGHRHLRWLKGITAKGTDLSLLQPNDGNTISSVPFTVSVSAFSPNQVSRIEIYLDGKFVKALPINLLRIYRNNENLTDGPHTIAAHRLTPAARLRTPA